MVKTQAAAKKPERNTSYCQALHLKPYHLSRAGEVIVFLFHVQVGHK